MSYHTLEFKDQLSFKLKINHISPFLPLQKRKNNEIPEINCVIDVQMDIEVLKNHPNRNIFRQVKNKGIIINEVMVIKE